MPSELLYRDLTEKIIGIFYHVHWELGPGFLESVYANAMAVALAQAGIRFEREVPIAVYFREVRVGSFRADMIVESVVLLEFKAGDRMDPMSEPKAINHLKATKLEVALVLHFGNKPSFKRLVVTNNRKNIP